MKRPRTMSRDLARRQREADKRQKRESKRAKRRELKPIAEGG